MQTVRSNREVQTQLSDDDRTKLGRIVALFGPFVELEPIGRYRAMTPDELWLVLVEEVCVMGSARPIERLQKGDLKKYEEFQEAVSVESLSRQQDHLVSYLSNTLHDFRAVRFYKRSSERIASMFKSSEVFQRGELVLLRGLSHEGDAIQTRDELIRRNPIFRLKSTSDLMISIGLSHDVIALDTRVVGVFQEHFKYNVSPGRIQSNRKMYLSLEATLREFCHEQSVSLALLDRLLFKFSVLNTIELVVKYPELTHHFG